MIYTIEQLRESKQISTVVDPTPAQIKTVTESMESCGITINPAQAGAYYHIAQQLAFNTLNPKQAKGICLSGPFGSGKTAVMKFISAYTRAEIIPVTEMTYSWIHSKEKCNIIMDILVSDNSAVILDDFGAESKALAYGNEFPMDMIIDKRFSLYDDSRALTHLTTNIVTEKELNAIYGDRITSRILGMCTFISLTGEDWRRK